MSVVVTRRVVNAFARLNRDFFMLESNGCRQLSSGQRSGKLTVGPQRPSHHAQRRLDARNPRRHHRSRPPHCLEPSSSLRSDRASGFTPESPAGLDQNQWPGTPEYAFTKSYQALMRTTPLSRWPRRSVTARERRRRAGAPPVQARPRPISDATWKSRL